jgi:hypothetical protein
MSSLETYKIIFSGIHNVHQWEIKIQLTQHTSSVRLLTEGMAYHDSGQMDLNNEKHFANT